MKDIVCPYCLNSLTESNLIRECNNKECHHKLKLDFRTKMELHRGRIPACNQAGCNGQYSIVKCPKCQNELPPQIARYDRYLRFALVGPSGCGKTNYITTLVNEIGTIDNRRFYIEPMNLKTDNYQRVNYKILYDNKEQIAATSELTPLQWNLFDKQGMSDKHQNCYSLTIFDGAGEDQAKILQPGIVSSYISGSKMIMLLLDPLLISGVVGALGASKAQSLGAPSEVSSSFTTSFVLNIINYLKNACNVKNNGKITIPIAVVVGKLDMLEDLWGSGMKVFEPSRHTSTGCFVESEADRIHLEMASWLNQHGDNLTKLFDENFKTWKYFGISSYGRQPKQGHIVSDISPLRVLDPLIWNLSLEGIVKKVSK